MILKSLIISKFILPLASRWVGSKEKEILEYGEPLSNELKGFADKIGIKHPEKVRILAIDKIPTPLHPLLELACEKTGLIPRKTAGITLNYGIFIRKDCVSESRIYRHELAHVLQYEQLGGTRQFLSKYLNEVMTYGYPNAPMEKEARSKENL